MKHSLSSPILNNKGNLFRPPLLPLGNQNMVRQWLPWLVPFYKLIKILPARIPDLGFQVLAPVASNKLLRVLVQLLTQRVQVVKISVIDHLALVCGSNSATGKKLCRMIVYKLLS